MFQRPTPHHGDKILSPLSHSSQLFRITTGDPINIKRTADGHTHFMLWLNERIYFERKTASFANYWRQYKIIRNVCN